MNLLAESDGTAEFAFTAPTWVLWGVGIAVAVMVLMPAWSWLFAKAWETMTFGFMGTTKDIKWPGPVGLLVVFATFGLLPGLSTAYVWAHVHPVVGVLVGKVVFAVVWIVRSAVEKQKRRY